VKQQQAEDAAAVGADKELDQAGLGVKSARSQIETVAPECQSDRRCLGVRRHHP
jgi:hypothetical protein